MAYFSPSLLAYFSTVVNRRIWVRIRTDDDTGTLTVQMGGLARTDNAGWGEEFDRLVTRLFPHAPVEDNRATRHNTQMARKA